ncbi:hypothetical protein ACFVWN_09470 [Nocardiopsis flavescens]|uniref:hypothetical protein n=1 Tax=Nocardiopsis flavescens TaxID=758803 RepID=UPI003666EE38
MAVSTQVSMLPGTYEASLDQIFLTDLMKHDGVFKTSSDWLIRIRTHFLGGRRHFGDFEIADIGVLVNFRRGGEHLRSKVVLLQSKRLYPNEGEYEEASFRDYLTGFGRFWPEDEDWDSLAAVREFSFFGGSRYSALKPGDGQYQAILEYESRHGIPVYYLLYNPLVLPWSVPVPLPANIALDKPDGKLGSTVMSAECLRYRISSGSGTGSPTFADLHGFESSSSYELDRAWKVEDFIADEIMDCREGYVARSPREEGVRRVFSDRSGPIAAALSITIDAPPGSN